MKENLLFRQGKAILKVRYRDDGTVLLFKPFNLTQKHLMNMTGAPGWDARYVDQIFLEDVDGELRYTFGKVEYSIDITTFRDRSFLRDDGFFPQYHCQVSHYTTGGWRTRDLPMEIDHDGSEEKYPVAPVRLVFGETTLCPRCHGKKMRKTCTRCDGRGIVPNTGPVPSTPPDGLG